MVGTLKQTVYRQSDMNRRKGHSVARAQRRPRNHPHPANLDLFPYEASARPVAGLAVDYEDGHRVRRHRHRRAQLLYAISGVMVVETEAGIWWCRPRAACGCRPGWRMASA